MRGVGTVSFFMIDLDYERQCFRDFLINSEFGKSFGIVAISWNDFAFNSKISVKFKTGEICSYYEIERFWVVWLGRAKEYEKLHGKH